jgi:UDP-GlcNAc:undecaprenyl-phosphate GlcNAc-1-phosphate transferase
MNAPSWRKRGNRRLPLEARLLTGLALSVGFVYLSTPLAIRVADRFEFYDKPVGYKGHAAPTPYLGGAAVIFGFLLVILLLTGDWQRTLPLAGGVVVLWAVGTIDDRRTVTPGLRVAIEVSLASALWALGLSWELGFGGVVDWTVSVLWVVAVVNAFNLFDNMDGAASSMACVVAGALAVLGIANGDTWLSVVAAALCGACAGFLPHNLKSPARIFLGDGGSMPIGFAVAALVMIGVGDAAREWQSLAMGLLFVGVPALDTGLVVVSRRRRGLSILTGGRDHLTHRARRRLQTARTVAVTLGAAQAVISALALVAIRGGSVAVVGAVVVYLVAVGVAITLLDTRTAVASPAPAAATEARPAVRRRPAISGGHAVLGLLVALGVGIGISPFFFGFYSSGVWVPAGLGLMALTTAGLIARPPRVSAPALLALSGLAAFAAWALTSSLWADSIEQAVVEGNRLLVYVMLLGLVVVLVRSDAAGLWLVGALTVAALAVGGVVLGRMLTGDAASLFLNGRLHSPLGYINGEAAFFLLALWPCIAAAEQRRSPLLSGAGLAGASLLGALLLLSGSRGVVVAAIVSGIVVLALVPGRVRRGWAMVFAGASLVVAGPALLNVAPAGAAGAVPDDVARTAAVAAVLAAAGAGVAWSLLTAGAMRSAAAERWLRPAAAGVLALGLAVVLVVGIASRDTLARNVNRQYDAFVALNAKPSGESGSARLVSGAGNRYDYWRIAWRAWKEHPIGGVGAGNYDGPYFERRATTEDVRQPHSLPLQALSELGVVGAGLLAICLLGVGWGAWRTARAARTLPAARFVAVAGIGAVSGWFVHTSVDWIHLLPGVTAIALVAAALLVRDRGDSARPPTVGARPRPRVAAAVLVAAGLALAGVSLSRQGMAEYFRGEAREALAANPAETLVQADRSLRLDPEAVSAYQLKAVALARFNEPAAARMALEEATRREPGDFVTWALLGDLAVRAHDFSGARAFYRRAHALNPRDSSLAALRNDPASAGAGILKP